MAEISSRLGARLLPNRLPGARGSKHFSGNSILEWIEFQEAWIEFRAFAYLFKFINQWAPRKVYFRSPKGSQKIFVGSSLGWGCPFEIIFPEGHTKLAFIKHVLTTYYVVKLQLAKFLMSQCQEGLQAFCSDNVIMWKSTIGPVQIKVTRPISW